MEDLLVLAASHHQAGRLAEAETLYRAVLQSAPYSADAHHNLGVLSMQRGMPVDEALRHFRSAWEVDPTHPQYGLSLARALAQAGRPDEARSVLSDGQRRGLQRSAFDGLIASMSPNAVESRAAEADPARAERQAIARLFMQRDFAEAEAIARSLTVRFREDGPSWKALGLAIRQQGRTAAALAPMQSASRLLPRDAETHAGLGAILGDLGRLGGAEAALRQAIATRSDFPLAENALGDVLRKLHRLPEAEAAYRRVIALRPDLTEAHASLGEVLASQGRIDEAIASLRRALDLKPDHGTAYPSLGRILLSLHRMDEAEALCRQVLASLPSRFEAHRDLGVVLAMQGRIPEAAVSCRNAVRLRPDDLSIRSALLFNLNYVNSETPEVLLAEARAYGKLASARAKPAFGSWTCATDPRRLRVGLVSADLCEHPVGYFLESVLACVDPRRIEWVAYPTLPDMDSLSQRLRAKVAGWNCLGGLADDDAARRIHADGIHVLMDLSGHTARNRLPVFAWRPAPVQTSWLGYFATTGVEQIDYLLADRTGVPPALQAHFTEKIWYLPDTRLCFTPPLTDLPVSALPALRRGYVSFGSFQTLAKVNDEVLALWGRVLAACAGSRLRLQAASLSDSRTASALLERLRARGIDPGRVDFHGLMPRDEYLAAYAEVDMLLDTFPYPGGTTTCEALWMGVPTVTLAGDTMLARQGASLLGAAGLSDWVANTPAEYVARAHALASDLPRLAALRGELRERAGASPLFDAPRFARHLEGALWSMWGARSSAGPDA
jgi:predicted O-linked N-acetylglucosamine transferase (SPINDLY family)